SRQIADDVVTVPTSHLVGQRLPPAVEERRDATKIAATETQRALDVLVAVSGQKQHRALPPSHGVRLTLPCAHDETPAADGRGGSWKVRLDHRILPLPRAGGCGKVPCIARHGP